MDMDFKFEGGRELEKLLMALPHTLARGSARRVLRKAAEPIRAEAARLAADDPATAAHDLHNSIGITSRANTRAGRRDAGNEVSMHVGVLTSIHQDRKPERKPYAAAMVNEFGSHKMPAHPFMRPAWDAKSPEAWDIMVTELRRDVARTIARFVRRGGAL
ncbi:HK97-gp10 family putative phage morphogenesis protein [uncultured Maritimibacter sp.]|jgi:HK97 gp10 family phage protein|uniref:HK97-gp10 family putative phage morphogenesis protein n=1 Tax=uncultured Maritimibacter sp. TaxID=991866 RepID=UPI00261CB909|nr:HK97-gp10 family putative phage morphogenesis protein [uncultured Maritimibacter sp.]